MTWRRLADWCVPASALHWEQLTAIDERPSVYIGRDGRGTAYVAGQRWPVKDGRVPDGIGAETWTLIAPSIDPTPCELLRDWERDRSLVVARHQYEGYLPMRWVEDA